MEDDLHRRELIQQLLLEAGRIMEDGSPDLALAAPDDRQALLSRIDQLTRDGRAIVALAAAAAALAEQPGS
ncbi:hypothetical protein G7A66_05580 [Altererythrobacter sp. SALINAS58]|uniref:hypothetical protein n=1 Tax=Alteripontixanthobacter muriae TaxID=2705546 RepID=UPI0015765EC9|nr:hypothetical protein [Alteripontixanthobacter muriae]NTZ42562.1 hypothetical protein [Alteripontixanthobacter muriae]